jgi:hypothetical protein
VGMLPSVEYLHSMICILRRPLYFGSLLSFPLWIPQWNLEVFCYGYVPIPYVPNTVHYIAHLMYGQITMTSIVALRFSKDYHHCGNVDTYTMYYTYICSQLCTLVPGYVLAVMYVHVRALLLNRHLIEWRYCGRNLSMTISIANSYN